jgi:chemotaxis protein CheC
MKDEMDILREVGSTAAAHGSTALSEMLGRRISLKLPSVTMLNSNKLAQKIEKGKMAIIIKSRILTGIEGKILFFLEEKDAFKLINMCYKMGSKKETQASLFTEIGISTIKEVGNIIISTYISSLNFFINKLIVPSFPTFINAPFSDIMHILSEKDDAENYILGINTVFSEKKTKVNGNLWVILSKKSAEDIKKACMNMLKK